MAYQVTVKETYKGGPSAREQLNSMVLFMAPTLEGVIASIAEDVASIHNQYDVIREWAESRGNTVTKKVLFTRKGKHGRLLKTFTVMRYSIQEYEDTLI